MKTALPRVLRRATVSTLVLSLVLGLAPTASFAQDGSATPVDDAFSASGTAIDADAVYAWTVSQPGQSWRVEVTAPAGESARVQLLDANGADLGKASAEERAALYDLALDPGTYEVVVPRTNRDGYAFDLAAFPEQERFDPEPNDQPERAVPIADGDTVSGRLARHTTDHDRYVLEVAAGDTRLRDIQLMPAGDGASHKLCLRDLADDDRQCRQGEGPLVLADLALQPGAHQVHISGRQDETTSYELSVITGAERAADYEAEPNDRPVTASALGDGAVARGRVSRIDDDYLDLTVSGEPQLWDARAEGLVERLVWVRGGREVAVDRPSCDATPALLEDLYLAPGRHRFMVAGCTDDGFALDDYTLSLIPKGVPDPEAEREPNNDEVRAEPYLIGERVIGRLPTTDDQDVFRFTLAAPAGLSLRLTQPPGADTVVRLRTGGSDVFQEHASQPGEPFEVDFWLEAGDYLLTLDPRTVGDGEYELTTERLDPFAIPVDAEPNNAFGFAREVPPTLTWTGQRTGDDRDADGYWLPPLSVAGSATIEITGDRPGMRLYSDPRAREEVAVEQVEDGVFVAADAPADVPLYLELWAEGDYRVSLASAGWTPASPPAEPTVAATLHLDAEAVAAYWTEGQAVTGRLTLGNDGPADARLELEARSDHYAFRPQLETTAVEVPAGSTLEVPVEISIDPDVWAGWPVHITVGAQAPDGGTVSATAALDGVAGAEPVGSRQAAAVPNELLGGLNVAAAALGGTPGGTFDADKEALLFDDVTPGGAGFSVSTGELPLELIVDLAGDSPVPVAGTVLNPLARALRLDYGVRDFEFLLSTDGTTWEPALDGKLERSPVDQHFVLESPVPATHAMLRVHSLHGDGRSTQMALGEWKVIAEPGATLAEMPSDIADPNRGGHVVRTLPHRGGPEFSDPIDDGLGRVSSSFDREGDGRYELVLGFQEARAAQVAELRWTDPDGSREDDQVAAVEVEVSTDGSLGPWTSLGWWDLTRADDGSVAPFVPEAPTWARYVRLALTVDPQEVRSLELPGRIDVLERAPDDDYRSILGEWGYTSRVGPYEWSVEAVDDDVVLDPDAGDTLDTATAIVDGETRTDRATIGEDVDWLRIEVPEDDNTLGVVLEGVPTVGVNLALYDADGAVRELRQTGRTQGRERYEAIVEPGSYFLEVTQPPFNVAFTFDTSGSMGPYLDFVFEGMRAFTSGIQPGRELAMILPFDELPLLDEWSDQPFVLEDAVNNYVPVKESSNILSGINDSARRLADRDGTRAILAVGDGEVGTSLAPELWASLEEVNPVVYTVHVGADNDPEDTRNMMQSWAATNSGVYDYPTTHAAMERAFERMSTRLRQPSVYSLTVDSSFVDRTPAALSVVAPEGQTLGLAGGTGVALILDTSGSMNKRLDGKKRIDIAKDSMKKLVRTGLAEGLPVSLRVFGGKGKKAGCETQQLVELGPLDRAATVKLINRLKIQKKTGTPIAAALRQVRNDLADVTGERVVVLITDGKATCKEDPTAALAELEEAGIEISLNIVGFALDDVAVKDQMRAWAEANRGSYYDATDAQALTQAVTVAVAAPVDVYAVSDREVPVATTTVGGEAVELEPGEYVLAVRSDPPLEVEGIVLGGGENLTYELEVPESLTADDEG